MRKPPAFVSVIASIALTLTLASCGQSPQQDGSSQQDGSAQQDSATQEDDGASTADASDADQETEAYRAALSGEGLVSSFIGEEFYEGEVHNADDALAAIESVRDRIGADDTTQFQHIDTHTNEEGASYYVFQQAAGDVLVHGASVKLITNKDGKAIGLVSSILPDIKIKSMDSWAIGKEKAEEVVRTTLDEQGNQQAKLIEDATRQTIMPMSEPSLANRYRYAWVVYSTRISDDVDMGYAAHYVDEDGKYLYSLPVLEPNTTEALEGQVADFDFDAFEPSTIELEVTKHDGATEKLTVPVLIDPESKDTYLADPDRKVLCADCGSYWNDQKIVPILVDESQAVSEDVLVYNSFLRIWDFYDSIGWKGPDNQHTPSLLLMNLLEEDGSPSNHAFYAGRSNGFQVFAFGRALSFGECIDIMAHEYSHCVTGTTMRSNLYRNDAGAINEAMSDILGNLAEMMISGNPDGAWLIGEGAGRENILRSMKDPHRYVQPEFAWDTYYVPPVAEGTDLNDNGGVHINSSLLNIVSYRLDQAGMPANDQLYYWMNVAFALTPDTDYPLMAELLPWCMEQLGSEYAQYVDPLKKAIEEADFTATEPSDTIVEGCGVVELDYPDAQTVSDGHMNITFVPVGTEKRAEFTSMSTWPVMGTTVARAMLLEGDYRVFIRKQDGEAHVSLLLQEGGWKPVKSASAKTLINKGEIVHVAAGETQTLTTQGLE